MHVEPQAEASTFELALGILAPDSSPFIPFLAPSVPDQTNLGAVGVRAQWPDGIFGPRTRDAIRKAQQELGLAPTGYLDAALIATIRKRTEKQHAAWEANHARRMALAARRHQPEGAVVPAAKRSPECQRNADGEITENQSFGCDVALLGESLEALFSPRS